MYTTMTIPVCHCLCTVNLLIKDSSFPIQGQVIRFDLSQSTYAVSLLLENLTTSYAILEISIQSVAPNNIIMNNSNLLYTTFATTDLSQESNTSVHIGNCYLIVSFEFCNLSTQTVQRSGTEWVNASFQNNGYRGMIVNKYCPNNYCRPEPVDVNLEHPDTQCAFSHSGSLCGGCQSGLSLALGSAQCRTCSNDYLALLIPFALAGFALVFLIKLLSLTVAEGTLNGLIFYANIVRANQVAWIPGLLNLGMLAGGTLYVSQSGESQSALAYTSIGIAFAQFVTTVTVHAIIFFKVVCKVHQRALPDIPQAADGAEYDRLIDEPVVNRQGAREMVISYDDFREPVLKYVDPQT